MYIVKLEKIRSTWHHDMDIFLANRRAVNPKV